MTAQLSLWTNAWFPDDVARLLREGTSNYHLINARDMSTGEANDALREADIAWGQPDADTLLAAPRLRWIHITSAGYTAYERDDLKAALRARGAVLTNSSGVYDEPCAQHVLAMMLADARQLLMSYQTQIGDRDWQAGKRRADSYLLNGQAVLILGFGAIARRLVQLLAPFEMNIVALRRQAKGDENVPIIGENQLFDALKEADHVVNILPESDATRGFMNGERFAAMKPGARFYNIGRGATVDQNALREVLMSGALELAYLDVTDPEPLPVDHALWTAPNCFITPHTAGGHKGEMERLARHFLRNLRLFENGDQLINRVF
jgi:phosphoglycerate dehydrogenase-like enzyme